MFKEKQIDYRLQRERDKMLWTDRDMWKAGFIGTFAGMFIATILWMS